MGVQTQAGVLYAVGRLLAGSKDFRGLVNLDRKTITSFFSLTCDKFSTSLMYWMGVRP